MLMMKKKTLLFVLLGFSSLFLQTACTKKATSVSGISGLARQEVASGEERGIAPQKESPSREEGIAFVPNPSLEIGADSIQEEPIGSEASVEKKEAFSGPSTSDISAALSDIYFDYDKSSLKSDSKSALKENARYLMLHPSVRVQIEGHTDERGSNAYNLALGARRARSVQRFLEALGVSAQRMSNISYGEENPACAKSKKSCWNVNRRVHFQPQAKK